MLSTKRFGKSGRVMVNYGSRLTWNSFPGSSSISCLAISFTQDLYGFGIAVSHSQSRLLICAYKEAGVACVIRVVVTNPKSNDFNVFIISLNSVDVRYRFDWTLLVSFLLVWVGWENRLKQGSGATFSIGPSGKENGRCVQSKSSKRYKRYKRYERYERYERYALYKTEGRLVTSCDVSFSRSFRQGLFDTDV